MKLVLNKCYGGFRLSEKACELLKCSPYSYEEFDKRFAPALIDVVEKLGKEASAAMARLKIVEIPDNATDWDINEYDGAEKITYVVDGKINYI